MKIAYIRLRYWFQVAHLKLEVQNGKKVLNFIQFLERKMKEQFEKIILSVGENINRNGLIKTPLRAEKAFRFLTKGYNESLNAIVNGAIFETNNDEMVIVKNIELYSLCEHHLLPFIGQCHVGYLPNKKVLGLSKIARIVDLYARRLQIQESLTEQIAKAVKLSVDAKGVGVVIEAQHLCMRMRGVEKQNSIMMTSMMLGEFKSSSQTRSEFLSLIK